MYDELTAVDIQKMQEEIDHRILVLRPQYIREVQEARAFGDLSENFEYKEAKRQKNHNDSRIRYLQRMIKTARVVPAGHEGEGVGLFDHVTLYLPGDEETLQVQLVTTLRVNAGVGRAIFGRRAGETVQVQVNAEVSYPAEIRAVERGEDDPSLPISQY